jgi:hypothetical protein
MKSKFVNFVAVVALAMLFSVPGIVRAVEEFKISANGAGVQIWFEAEDYDLRDPDTDEFYLVAPSPPAGVFGDALTRVNAAGGMISWTFDISQAGGTGGTWTFWGRIYNPDNLSDYMLVEGDPDDALPTGPPYPGSDGTAPFTNDDDRIFEETVEDWGWWGDGDEGSTKELQSGENTMYIYHRQGDTTVFWDVFMWSSDPDYVPTDDDYINAESRTAAAVQPSDKLSTTWGSIKERL